MAGIDYVSKIPNNVELASNRRLQRALEDWQPKFIEWWKDMGPDGFQAKETYLRTASERGRAGLGAVRLRDDARVSLGHLPRGARGRSGASHSARPRDSRRGRRCRVSIAERCDGSSSRRATPSRRQGRAAAAPRPDVSVALRSPQPVPGERRGRPAPVGDGVSPPGPFRSRRPRRGGDSSCSAAPAIATSRASSAPSTSRRRTGSRTSCSATSRTATGSTSSPASPRAAPIRSRAHGRLHAHGRSAPHVHRRERDLHGSCSARARSCASTRPTTCASTATSTCRRSSGTSTSTARCRSTSSARRSPRTPRTSTRPASRAGSRRRSGDDDHQLTGATYPVVGRDGGPDRHARGARPAVAERAAARRLRRRLRAWRARDGTR